MFDLQMVGSICINIFSQVIPKILCVRYSLSFMVSNDIIPNIDGIF